MEFRSRFLNHEDADLEDISAFVVVTFNTLRICKFFFLIHLSDVNIVGDI